LGIQIDLNDWYRDAKTIFEGKRNYKTVTKKIRQIGSVVILENNRNLSSWYCITGSKLERKSRDNTLKLIRVRKDSQLNLKIRELNSLPAPG
jgi:hypothetical protein